MKAMVLAAGRGVRMFPLTVGLPKPAIPVLGRPLVLQVLCRLARSGVDLAVVNLHHLGERLRAVVGAGAGPGLPEVRFTEEPEILGTAGGLRLAARWLRGDGPFVVHNGDTLSEIDLRAAVTEHLRSGRLATLVSMAPRPGYAAIHADDEGRVVALAEPPPPDLAGRTRPLHFTGVHVLDESVLERIPPGGPSDIVRDVYRPLAREGLVGAHVHDGFWWDFGSPESYLDGTLRLLDLPPARLDRIATHDPVRLLSSAVAAVGPGAEIHPDAELHGRAALGLGSHVEAGCRLEDCVVMPEAWVGPGCKLRRVVVGRGTELPAGFELGDALVCLDPDPALDPAGRAERIGGLLVRRLGPTAAA